MEDMVMESMPEFQELKPGQVIKSKVIAVYDDKVIVDLGLKMDGFLDKSDFQTLPEVGEEIDIYISRLNPRDGTPVISHSRAREMGVWKKLEDDFASGRIIEGRITKKVKGGFELDVGMPAFMPSSQLAKKYLQNPENTVVELKITKLDKKTRNIVISNKLAEKESNDIKKEKVFSSLNEGDIVKGKITTITDFGIFVDLGGIDGLLHINDVSYKRIGDLQNMFKLGDTLEVKVLKFDPKENKIALGLKQLQKNPWDDVEEKFKPNMRIKGKITSLTPFGAFVFLEDGIEGLIHVSDISWTERIVHPKDVFKEGQEVEAIVLESSVQKHKISLSYKATLDNPYDKFKAGEIVSGDVVKLMDFGCLIKIDQNIHGFVHVSEISKSRIDKPSDVLAMGENVSGKVIKIDKPKKRIEISIKQLDREQEEQDVKGFMNSQETKIKFADLIENNDNN